MKYQSFALACAASLSVFSMLQAQDQPSFPAATQEHQWLQKFVGEWETEAEGTAGPDQPPMKMTGTIQGRKLGDFWIVNEVEANIPAAKFKAIQTIGYDAAAKKYVGNWCDSMTHYLWQYEGHVDETGKILTLEAEGPNPMANGEITRFRDAYEFESPDHIVATSSMQGKDGKWVTFMTGHSKRKK